jgi:hypothetical protein
MGRLINYTNKYTTVSSYRILSILDRLIYSLHQQTHYS